MGRRGLGDEAGENKGDEPHESGAGGYSTPVSSPAPLAPLLMAVLGVWSCSSPPTPVDEVAVLRTFETLHRQVYEVYALPLDRDRIHQVLEASFSGPALTDEYIEHFTTRVRMDDEATAIDIVRVDYDQVQLLDVEDGRIRVDASWSVGGVVTHQGHRHTRVNRYEAVYTLADTPAGLRIVDTRLRNLRRVRRALGSGFADFGMDESEGGSSGGFMSPLELLQSGLGDEPTAPDEAPATQGAP